VSGAPVSERAEALDALRGFALLGILITHLPDFSGYTFMSEAELAGVDRFGLDAALWDALQVLIRGKFLALFALLFGVGFSIQLESAARRGDGFPIRYARRLGALFVIGACHAAIWYGDILKDYALLGFVLLAVSGCSVRTVAALACVTLLLRLVWPLMVWAAVSLLTSMPGGGGGERFFYLARSFSSPDFSLIFAANLDLVGIKALQFVYEGRFLSVLAMFLIGATIGRLQLYRNLRAHRSLFRTVLLVAAPIGLAGNFLLLRLHSADGGFPPTLAWIAEQMTYALAVPALTLAYASAFALLWTTPAEGALKFLAPAGRTALTTYVSQTLIGVALFYGVGLNLQGRLGLVELTALAFAIFAVQTAAAALWLGRFRFGPLEWAWRCATYGALLPLRAPTIPRR